MLAGIEGSNPAVGHGCLYRCVRRADPPSRGVLPNVVCLSKIVKSTVRGA